MSNILMPFKDPERIIFSYGSQYNTFIHTKYDTCYEVQVSISNILVRLKTDYNISNIYFLIDPETKYNVEEKLNGKLIKCVGLESYIMPLEDAFDSLISNLLIIQPKVHQSPLIVIISYVEQEICATYNTLIGYSLYVINDYGN